MKMTPAISPGNRSSVDQSRRKTSCLLLLPMLAFAACKTAHVSSDYDHGTQFSSFHTFTMVSRPHPSAKNPLAVQRTTDAIREELTRKGFVYVEDATQADFAVDFSIGAQDRLDVSSTPAAGWAGPWFSGRFSGNEVNVRQYQEGTLSIDVFDMHSRKAVWRGSGKKELSQSEVEKTSTVIREAVTSVLADFPPKAT